MCGRFASYFDENTIVDAFGVERVVSFAPPSWNVAPTQGIDLVRQAQSDVGELRELREAQWGLVPHWAKDRAGAARLINARSETVTEKPSFRVAARRRRALIPAAGYYEWQAGPDGKTPYYLHPEVQDQPLAFAGLYEWWDKDPGPDRGLLSATIITQPATDTLGQIHDRMPVVVPPSFFDDWLDPATTDPAQVKGMIAAMGRPSLVPRRVSKAVGSVRNNGPGLIEPALG
ncbi:MAG: SOS response-associated peptidase [Micrococcales bacterium]|nr:SOS response-associated peptidase [Micrococcales bacterium]